MANQRTQACWLLALAACGGDPTTAPRESAPASAEPRPPTPPVVVARGFSAAPVVKLPSTENASAWQAPSRISDLQVRTDGSILVAETSVVSLLDPTGVTVLRRFDGGTGWSPDGEWIVGRRPVTQPDNNVVLVWRATDEAPATEIPRNEAFSVVAVSSAGTYVAILSAAKSIEVLERSPLRKASAVQPQPEHAYPEFVDETTLVVVGPKSWQVYTAATGQAQATVDVRTATPDNGWRAWAGEDRLAVARGVGEVARTLEMPEFLKEYFVGPIVVDSTGERVAFEANSYRGDKLFQIVVFSLTTGDALLRAPKIQGPLAFTPDGARLAAVSERRVVILDLASRTVVTP
jgi:hypothetical protein